MAAIRTARSYASYRQRRLKTMLSLRTTQVQWATQNPVSTFAVDVDTAAYANVRRMLNSGHLPPRDAVRVEEFLNYFPYDYALPENNTVPFSLHTELGSSPWDERKRLLHIGIQGWKPAADEAMPAANLVFLIDVSGSMRAPNKIGLLKSAMKMLGRQLRSQDRLAIAVYAGASGEVLAPTSGAEYAKIEAAIDSLNPGGSTNGGAGIELAYRLAQQGFVKGGINRVILATDGDFNVGVTDPKQLEQMIERKRKDGVALSVLGFGSGNYNDALMQKLAQIGDGNAAYIDTMNEARKVLVDELGSTLNIIAKDMKVQIEFNPAIVDTYRLVGYETRKLNREDFNNDAVDAGEIGAGHSVTALYELTLVGDADAGAGIVADPLRYADAGIKNSSTESARNQHGNEVAFLKVRYKEPEQDKSQLIQQPINMSTQDNLSAEYQFSASVAWFAQVLRENQQIGSVSNADYRAIVEMATKAKGDDPFGYRGEFVNLVRTAAALTKS